MLFYFHCIFRFSMTLIHITTLHIILFSKQYYEIFSFDNVGNDIYSERKTLR